MIITKKLDTNHMYFNQLTQGDTFMMSVQDKEEALLMKTEEIHSINGVIYNAVYVYNGELITLKNYDSVYKIKTKVIME